VTVPLSYAQQRLWFLHRLGGPPALYTIPIILRIEGALDADALDAALGDVVTRHESLRTICREEGGVVAQHVLDERPTLIREDVDDLRAQLADAASTTIDIERELPLRGWLFRAGPGEHVLLILLHHIAADGWSLAPLLRDLTEAYDARRNGKAPDLPPLPVQYADYTFWQRDLLGDANDPESLMARQLGFWRKALAGMPEELTLPGARPRPAAGTSRGVSAPFRIDAALHRRLLDLARAGNATLFMVLQAGLAALLARLGCGTDIAIGTAVAGRGEAALEELIGFFVNTLVLRTDVSGQPTFRELLGRVRAFDLDAYSHQDVPFERVVDALQPDRSLSRHPLFQVVLALQNAPAPSIALADLVLAPEALDAPLAKFDLAVSLTDIAGELHGEVVANADLLDARATAALAARLLKLLEAATATPDVPLYRLDILAPSEREVLAPVQALEPLTLPELFEAQVARDPDAIALDFGGVTMTYGELNARAGRVATALHERGVEPESIVGIAFERSFEMWIAILGALKAGAAYLPLDPDYPEARRAHMMADAKPALVLRMPLPEPRGEQAAGPSRVRDARQTAYVIYTSGSTGMPKGVAVTHAGIASLRASQLGPMRLGPGSRLLQFASLNFDAAAWELIVTLTSGATLVLLKPEERSGRELQEVLARERITHALLPPAVLPALDENDPRLALECLIVGGEACSAELARRWSQRWTLLNAYGPTETTVIATMSGPLAGAQTPPIGQPICNTRVYVLDAALEPMPPGITGELYVAGAGLARGYLNRAALTAERFVADPHAAEPSARMYRTGDLARWRDDGALEYAGRADEQVKLRGFRVEPGEVQAVLEAQEGVAQAAVLVRDRQLVAWVAGVNLDAARLRGALLAQLPDFMVPSVIIPIDALPLNANGKLDVNALRLPAADGGAYRMPRDDREARLCALVAELLSLDRIGIDDNFFAIGGDSILSIRLVARARAAGLRISARDVFQQQTVKRLAAVASEGHGGARAPDDGVGEVVPTPIIRWLLERGVPSRFHQSIMIPVELTEAELLARLQMLLDRHDALRFHLGDGRWLHVAPRGSVAAGEHLARVDLRGLDADERQQWLNAAGDDAVARLEPRAGRMFEAVWFDGDHGALLLLVIHHLAVDSVSWRILVDDFLAPPANAVPTSFRAWARLLDDYARTPGVLAELPQWEAILARGGPLVPGAMLDPALDTIATSRELRIDLPAAPLAHVCSVFHARMDDVLLAALMMAVAASRGDDGVKLLVEVEGHGREPLDHDVDLSGTVGWFTTLFPVALAGTALPDIKEQLRAVPGHGLGYGLLRDRLASHAAPQVGFNYFGRGAAGGESVRIPEDPSMPLFHLLDINAQTVDCAGGSRLVAHWRWAARQLDAAGLARRWQEALEALSAEAQRPGAGGHVPSDFPLVSLTREELARIERTYPDLEDILPLSPLQHGLLFHSLFDDRGADVYATEVELQLEGPLEVERLRAAAHALLLRHPNLRAAIVHEGLSRPVQVIRRDAVAWREGEARAERFVLADGSLLRFTLTRLPDGRHALLLSSHHVLMDGWSMPLVVGELFALYANQPLPPVRPYAGYLAWIATRDTEGALAAWRAYLAGADGPTLLAAPRTQDAPPALPQRLEQELPADLTARIQQLAIDLGVTLNTIVQTIWGVTLGRLTGRDDVVFGITVAGRPPEVSGVERMVGLFINTLPLRIRLRPGTAISALIAETQASQAELFDAQYAGLTDIQRAASTGELFDTLVVFENYPTMTAPDGSAAPELRIAAAKGRDAAHYPLALVVVPHERLSVRFDFDPRAFDAAAVERIAGEFVSLLEAAAGDRDAPLHRLARRSLSAAQTGHDVPDTTITALIETQVARTPDAIALLFEDEMLTYSELNARANGLAHELMRRSVGPESVVAITLHRSVEMVVAILGTVKAGAAYLPLDPDLPRERRERMLADAQPAVVIDSSFPALHASEARNPVPPLRPEHPAYVIYTSGSTGMPKGAPNTHRALVNRILWMQSAYPINGSDRVLQKTPYSFDVSVWEFFWPLMTGAALVVALPEMHKDPQYLADLIASRGVTTVHFVPSMLRAFLSHAARPDLPLRQVLCSGEALGGDLQQQFFSAFPNVALHNLYGPTEAAIDVTAWTCRADGGDATPPIGMPIWNTRVYVLDSALEPVADGVAGDLYLAGTGLARGYLNRRALTAERFVADPYGPTGSRMYRTGDLGRRRADGAFEFLGRADQQVKIRGFRIELGEIEAALASHPAVAEAAVVARGEQLVAYVVTPGWYELPNGMLISHQNRSESDFLYGEIFEDETYLQHGIALAEDACVFDVGANVGLFTLFVRNRAPRATVYAFEPIPRVFESLRLNAEAAGGVKPFQCALSNTRGEAAFTWYRHNSVISGRHAGSGDVETVKTFLRNRGADDDAASHAGEWLDSETVTCELRTLSDVIAEEGIERIDLLKIDVEKSELEVLEGLDASDWARVEQLVIEVHDLDGRLATISRLLEMHGFTFAIEQSELLRSTNLHSIYARRPGAPCAAAASPPPVRHALREHLAERLPDYMVPAMFVSLDQLPLSPNGKLDRRALPAPERRAGALRAPRTDAERILCQLFAELLRLDHAGVDDHFFRLGGDSIVSIQLVSRARAAGLEFTPRDVFQHPTVESLAAVARIPQAAQWKENDAVGDVVLTPIMRWLFEQRSLLRTFHQSMLLPLPDGVTGERLLAALQTLLDHHDVLRMRLDGERLHIPPRGSVAAAGCLLVAGRVDRAAAQEAEARLDPAAGRMLKAVWFAEDARLFMIIHHLAVDGVSWRILMSDLAAVLAGESLVPTTPFRVWAAQLPQRAQPASTELPRWEQILDGGGMLVPHATLDASRDTNATAHHLTIELPILTSVAALFHARVDEVLLAALAAAHGAPLLVEVEGHGRDAEELDVSRTVGWFTTVFPVRIDARGAADLAHALKRVKSQLRAVPSQHGFGLLRYLNPETAPQLAARPRPQIQFNYLGRFEGGTAEQLLLDDDPSTPLSHLLRINAQTVDGAVTATWSWAGAQIADADVRALAESWKRVLGEMAKLTSGGHTVSDFPLVSLQQGEVEMLEAEYGGLTDVLPLSPLQEGLAFHALYDERARDVYSVQVAIELDEPIDSGRLRAACEELLRRHPNLRIRVRHQGLRAPVQVVAGGSGLRWREAEGVPRDEFLRAERNERFDLANGPLVRAALLHLDRGRQLFAITVHHVVLDGWSMPLFFGELFALYQGNVPPHAPPYAGYLAWLAKQDRPGALAVWRDYLADVDGPTLVAPRGAKRAAEGRVTHELSEETTARLQQLARDRGVTLNGIFESLWAVFLRRLTGRDDVVFGVTVSGRPAEVAGVERMIGLFINTVPRRVRMRPGQTAAQLFAANHQSQAQMSAYECAGLADIQRAAGLPELFDTLMVFENYPAGPAAAINVTAVEGHDATHYPLSLLVVPGKRLRVGLEFDPSRFAGDELVARFVRIIESAAADPELPLYRADSQPFSGQWHERGLPSESVASLFEAQARRTPEAPAIEFGDETISYRELNERADFFARQVREACVTVSCERSPELVIALLGALKAGAAFLPLDPRLPAARIAAIIAAVQPPPRGAAYVMFTSGSTGVPKGVVVDHAALANKIVTLGEDLGIQPATRYAVISSIGVDPVLEQILVPLCAGGTCVIVPDDVRDDPRLFAALRLSVLDATPGFIENLLQTGGLPRGLETLLIGGEVLPPRLASRLLELRAAKRILNMYGPTEACIDAAFFEVTAPVPESVPIGSALPNYRMYVLDSGLEPLPDGVTGELYIAGAGLARGYANQPALTAERFVADPHGPAGARMYRTGDLARRLPDGAFEFAGRADQQVKVRGFRIEPAEVEHALRECDGVSDAAVIARDDGHGAQLTAYVVSTKFDPAALRETLAARLPPAMIPAAFVALDALPRTPSGKIDRRALPAPERQATSGREPRTAEEQTLCALFADVLGVEHVGIDDNFFELGGHSLLATQLVSRVRTAFAIELPIRAFFDAPTIDALAPIVTAQSRPLKIRHAQPSAVKRLGEPHA
jgi:amino acid adenylation domain-containing protein/FkbM family methyltransferase/non-ribosomal peptide synthase protein (TIGR01720 family)